MFLIRAVAIVCPPVVVSSDLAIAPESFTVKSFASAAAAADVAEEEEDAPEDFPVSASFAEYSGSRVFDQKAG